MRGLGPGSRYWQVRRDLHQGKQAMTIEFTCVCGKQIRAKDEWVGRRAKCTQCGQILTVPLPDAAGAPPAAGTYDLLNQELSAQTEAPPATTPFASSGPRSQKKRGFFNRLARKLGAREILFKWQEPLWYRSRVREDVSIRWTAAGGAWAAVAGVFLVFFGANVNPPPIWAAVLVGAMFGLMPGWMILFVGRKTASGLVRVYRHEISRVRYYTALDFHSWTETATWPHEAIERCVIVPEEVLGKSFSVMLLTTDSGTDIVGIPRKVDLGHLSEHLTESGIQVERGESVPASFTKKLGMGAPTVFGVIGTVCFMGGLTFYVQHAGPKKPLIAEAEEFDDKFPETVPQDAIGDLHDSIKHLDLPPKSRPPSRPQSAPQNERRSSPSDVLPESMPVRPTLPGPEPPIDLPFAGGFGDSPQEFPSKQIESLMSSTGPSYGTPGPRPVPAAALKPGDTNLVGGSGGFPFRTVDPDGKAVIGFRYSMGSWAGQPALHALEPVFSRDNSAGSRHVLLAREGYVVAGLKVHAGDFVHGVQVVFTAIQADGKLNPADSYTSEWIGESSETTTSLGATGAKVLGVHGRRGAIVDSIGLVTEVP